MMPDSHSGGGLEEHHFVRNIQRRFMQINNERLALVRKALKPRQRLLLDILPLLFHHNEPLLPGYVGDACPCGIYDYSPSSVCMESAVSLIKEFQTRRAPMRVYNLYALYIIGSAGTIAYTDKSDLDIWICHRPDIPEEDVELIKRKGELISEWAATIGMEINFFVLTPQSIREGNLEALSEESSGSAQHLLLVEEFYRSGLLLGGRYPAWWLVPPDKEHEYHEYLKGLLAREEISEHDIIDFGDVSGIPASEFYGAALWQLNKAIASPYKSMLKLLLMEAYASEYPDTELLCTRLKRAIYDGETDIDKLDSYVLMIHKLDEYLSSDEHRERQELARRCFYFKVHEWLTENIRSESRTREIMYELTTRWNWSRDDLLTLDTRQSWKIDRVLEERSVLVNELTRSYRMLTDFARQHSQETSISQNDLNILGRRLYAAFERKAGKVDLINPGISVNLAERKLTYVHTSIGGTPTWLLFRGDFNNARDQKHKPIKRAQYLIEMVAWCHFNRITGSETINMLQNQVGKLESQELLGIIDSFRELFPDGHVSRTNVKELSEPANIQQAGLFINLGHDPMLQHTRKGLHLASSRSDALSYGGMWQNLVNSCDLVVVSTWGEILTFHYEGRDAMLECLCDYLAWTPIDSGRVPVIPKVFTYLSSHTGTIIRRIETLFKDLSQVYYRMQWRMSNRYILRVERNHVLLQPENRSPRYQVLESDRQLMEVLSEPQDEFSPYIFDRYATDGGALRCIQQYNRPDVIQLFFYLQETTAFIYILDELGSLFYQEIGYYDTSSMLGHYRRFFESAIKRRKMMESTEINPETTFTFDFYQIKSGVNGALYVDVKNRPKLSQEQQYFSIQVIGDPLNQNTPNFSLFCDGVEFSTLEYGNNVLEEAVEYILGRRKLGERYPIYITDIDVTMTHLGKNRENSLQTVQLLQYKRAIEEKLNQTLERI